MFCQQCGKEIPPGSPTCPACGYLAMPHSSSTSSAADSIEVAVAELKRTAKELAKSARTLSQRVVAEAGKAAKDPPGSAKRAAHKVAQGLEEAAKEIEQALRDL